MSLVIKASVCIKTLHSQVVPEAITIFFPRGVRKKMALPWLVEAINALLEGLHSVSEAHFLFNLHHKLVHPIRKRKKTKQKSDEVMKFGKHTLAPTQGYLLVFRLKGSELVLRQFDDEICKNREKVF